MNARRERSAESVRASAGGGRSGGGRSGGGRAGIVARLTRRTDPLTSLVLTTPVFLVYHVGLLLTDVRNGVDFVSGPLLALAQASLPLYLGLTALLAGGIVLAGWALRGRGEVHPRELVPVLVESAIWAALLAVTVGWVTARLFAFTAAPLQAGPPPLGPLGALVLSAGAGFHEELVFRVGFFAGGAALLARFGGLRPVRAALVAAVGSALIFSAAHYVGPFGDPFALTSFTFRALFGLALAGLYRLRGFAIAVYAHALYDVFVFGMRLL